MTVVAGPSSVRAQGSFPYTAHVVGDGVSTHSGPGEKYYATESLGTGQSVEVYKHLLGWAAIRPPEDSFSWVAADFLKPVNETMGVVIGERVVSRVGSQFEEQRDVIQVFLDHGEEVDLLDPEPFPDADGERDWYMIAPPAGEFRWVRLSDLDSGQLPSTLEPRGAQEPKLLNTINHDRVITSEYSESPGADYNVEQAGAPIVRPPVPESSPTSSTASRPASRQAGSRWKDYRESLIDNGTQATAPVGPKYTGPIGDAAPYTATSRGGYVSYTDQLNEIELEIATMVAKDPAYWAFAPARTQLADVMTRAETAVERGRAQSLTRKIDRLDDLKSRYVEVVRGRGRSSTDSLVASERARSFDDLETSTRSTVNGGSGSEVTGLLRPVVSKRPDAPAYALMDDNGQVRTFVSEAPGVQLRNYVGRRVGVSGTVDYVPELKADHVTARRVGIVDQPLRR